MVSTMSGPFIDDAQIGDARRIAGEVIEPIFDLIQRNTTVSVERTVLRFFGIAGAGVGGVPLVNLMVDRLHAAKVLGKGAAYWYGRALLESGRKTEALPVLARAAQLDPGNRWARQLLDQASR